MADCIVLVVWICSRTIPEQKRTWGPPHPCSDTNQLESNHHILCQPIQINVTLYQTTFYECIPFSSSIHRLQKVGVSTCKIKAFQCLLTKRVCDDRTFVMLEPVASLSRTHSSHIRDYQSLVSVKQTLVHSQRGKTPKAGSKKLSGQAKIISRLPKHLSVISGVSPAPFLSHFTTL